MRDAKRDAVQRARWSNDFVGSSLGFNGLGKIMLKNSGDYVVLMPEEESLTSPNDKILIEVAKEGYDIAEE